MKARSTLGIVALTLLAAACSESAPPTEALGTGSEAILQGTSASPLAGGHVYLATPTTAGSGSGTLLNNEWVLTAAHVADDAVDDPSQLLVDLGTTTIKASEIHLHPLWNGDGEGDNPNVVDIALVRLSTPFPGGPFQHTISPRNTPDIIDNIHDTRCFGYGPTDIANPKKGVLNGTALLEPPFNTADFTLKNFPPFRSNPYRSNFGMVAFPNALNQMSTQGDSGGGCFALTPDANLYAVTVAGDHPDCVTNADCKGIGDQCNIDPATSKGHCRVPTITIFEAAQGFRGFAEARMRQRTTAAHLTGPTSNDQVTLRLDALNQFVLDFQLQGLPPVTIPTGVADVQHLGTLAQLEVADFDGDTIDDALIQLEGTAITGETGRFGILFSSEKFGTSWQQFLTLLVTGVPAGTIVPTRDFPFFVNSTFSFLQSVGMDSSKPKGLTAVQTHGGTLEYYGTHEGLIQDLPPRGFDFDGDGLDDIASTSRHRLDILLGSQPGLASVSVSQQDLGGDPTTSWGPVAWGDFDGSCTDPDEPCQHELVVGNPREPVAGEASGAVYYLTYEGVQRELTRANHAGLPKTIPAFGSAFAVGDFNDDGYDDLAVALADDVVGNAVSVISGGPSGLTVNSPVETLTPGTFALGSGFFGLALTAGDFNCDGVEDLAISSPFHDQAIPDVGNAGTVVVIDGGGPNLASAPYVRIDKDTILPPPALPDDLIGMSLTAGNFDGDLDDGHACVDLVIGASHEDRYNLSSGGPPLGETGAVYVVRGSPAGLTNVGLKRLVQGSFGIHGTETEGALFGENLAVGRMNEDRFDDLIVGNPFEDGENGAVHVLLGSANGIASSGHGFYQQGDGKIPNGLLPDTADTGDRFGSTVGSLSRGLVAVGASSESLNDVGGNSVSGAGLLGLVQFAENEQLLVGEARTKSGAAVPTVGEVAEDYFARKPAGQSVEDFLVGDYATADFDTLVADHGFGGNITSARPPLGTRLFSKRTDLGRELNFTLLVQSGGLGRLKAPDVSAPPPAVACYHAVQNLEVRDRAALFTTRAVAGNGFKALADAHVFAALEIKGAASARDRAVIEGDVRVSGTLSLINNADQNGPLTEHATINIEALTTPVVVAGTTAVTVNGGTTRPLSPGAYGDVLVRANGKLVLGSGEYRFKSLTVEGELVANTLSGSASVNVAQAFVFRDRARVSAEDPRRLRFNAATTGTITIGTDAFFAGYLSAPKASVEVGSRSETASCMAAYRLIFQPDARINGLY